MGRHGFPPITPLSAALTLVQWAQQHERMPRSGECSGVGGLLWYSTYYRILQVSTWSAVLSATLALTSGVALGGARPRKRCANYPDCQEWIDDEGKHIRYCQTCKHRIHAHYELEPDYSMLQPALTRRELQRYGLHQDSWEDLLNWEAL